MAVEGSKVVLVCIGEHKREVRFKADDVVENERKNIEQAIAVVFSDVVDVENKSLLLQVKNEGWNGEYVDLEDGNVVANGAVVKAVFIDEVWTCMHANVASVFSVS